MAQKDYTVGGRTFRTAAEYALALKDYKRIEELREKTDFSDREALTTLLKEIRGGKYPFQTMLAEDFRDELREAVKRAPEPPAKGRKKVFAERKEPGRAKQTGDARKGRNAAEGIRERERGRPSTAEHLSEEMKGRVQEEIRKREKRRKLTIALCSVGAACCLGYFGVYSWFHYRSEQVQEKFSQLKEMPTVAAEPAAPVQTGPLYTLDEPSEPREVLEEYKNLLNRNKTLIGWVKIDDTNIDYPVVQALDNEYYLTHNLDQEYDRNGTIFLDKDCDIAKPSTNYIVYGHHMKSGKMFGTLDRYAEEDFCREHPQIQFDTIYEKGIYEVMYVFRSRVYSEEDIVFKYYQFIDANSEQEFNSYMNEMDSMSLYDTGVTAEYGDQLLTLSTCDYQEKNGRFVVVAKRIKE
ncbi:MAG: class B sortase [bacterium]|nr:class B sortase [bacterium]